MGISTLGISILGISILGTPIFGISIFGISILGSSPLGGGGATARDGSTLGGSIFGGRALTRGASSSSSSSLEPPLNALNAANPPNPSTAGAAASTPAGGPPRLSFPRASNLLFFPELPLLTRLFAVLEFPPLLVAASYASSAFSVGCGRLGVGGATVVSVGAGGVPALGITSPSAVATPLDATTPAAKTPMATFFPTRVASSSLSSLVSSLARVTARPRPDLDDVDVVLRIVVARVAATRGAFVRADMTNETFPRAFVRRSRARERRVGVWRWIKRDTALYLGDARERARRGRAVTWRRDTRAARS